MEATAVVLMRSELRRTGNLHAATTFPLRAPAGDAETRRRRSP